MKKICKILPAIFILFFIALYANAQQEFVGSKTSNKYHYPTCKWVKEIKPHKVVKFDSPEKAAKAGYIACPTCRPPLPVPDKTASDATAAHTIVTDSAGQKSGLPPAKSFFFNLCSGFLLLFLLLFVPFFPGLAEIIMAGVHLPEIFQKKKGLTK